MMRKMSLLCVSLYEMNEYYLFIHSSNEKKNPKPKKSRVYSKLYVIKSRVSKTVDNLKEREGREKIAFRGNLGQGHTQQ